MPELPEVETICRGLAAAMANRRLVRVETRRRDLRRPLPDKFAERLTGRAVVAIGRRAKYILIRLKQDKREDGEEDDVLLVHLGMSGRMTVAASEIAPAPHAAHDHVVFHLDDGAVVRFNDARRFGSMALACAAGLERHPLLAGLGPEPLDPDFDGPALAARLRGKRTPIKAALLDQRVVAGLGNIYVCEALFRAGISPRRMAATVQGERARRLAAAIGDVLNEAIAAGGSTLRDHVRPNGELGYFQHHFAVYGREGERCADCRCRAAIKRIVQSGRSTFFCPQRQR